MFDEKVISCSSEGHYNSQGNQFQRNVQLLKNLRHIKISTSSLDKNSKVDFEEILKVPSLTDLKSFDNEK